MILGIETSTAQASLALYDAGSDAIVWESEFSTDRAHNAVIFDPVSEMLALYRNQLSGIVVGVGPGSYSGVRVGIAVANGLSLALEIPSVGRSSLEAWGAEGDTYAVLGDARRRTFFVAEVKARQLQGDPDLIEEDLVEDRIARLKSDGVPLYTADPKVQAHLDGVVLCYPTASRLARAGAAVDPADWQSSKPLEPHYLRAPYITTPKKKQPRS